MTGEVDELAPAAEHPHPGAGAADRGGDIVPRTPAVGDAPAAGSPRDRRRTALVVGGLTAVVAVPLVVAVVALRSPTWYPSVDLALIEMRVRDVGTRHTPLLGPGGRFSAFGEQGNHPGPIGYYALAPVYRLLGSGSWALQAASASIALAASAVGIWIGHRRAGLLGALATTAGLLALLRLYGPEELTSPWNPNVAMVWWVVLLLAAWSLLCRDYAVLPVAAFAGAFCAQSHIAYIGLVGGVAALTGLALAADAWRHPELRRPLARWTAVGAAVAVVACLPVIVEQVTHDPGNLSVILESFRHPEEDPVGVSYGWDLARTQLDFTPLATGGPGAGADWPAYVLLTAWVASVGAALRMRRPALLRLHAVAGGALLLSFVAISRIAGYAWPYLMLWARGSMALPAAAVVATAVLGAAALLRAPAGAGTTDDASGEPAADRNGREARADDGHEALGAGRRRGVRRPVLGPPPRWAPLALGAVVAVVAVLLSVDAARVATADAELSSVTDRLVDPTAAAIDADVADRPDAPEPTLVTFTDPVDLGSAGFTLHLALEREGYEVRAAPTWRAAVGDGRTIEPVDAGREVHIAVGDSDVERWRADPAMEEVAVVDPRSDAERVEVDELEATIVTTLEDQGLEDLARTFETVRMAAALDARMPPELAFLFARLGELPQPVAVFLSTEPGRAPA